MATPELVREKRARCLDLVQARRAEKNCRFVSGSVKETV